MEKTIIIGENYRLNIKALLLSIAAAFILIGLLIYICGEGYSDYWEEWRSIIDVMFDPFSFISGLLIDLGIILVPIVLVISWWLSSAELTVTEKRVYGKAAFGKRVDLPLDSISSVGTSCLKGIDVGTSSGSIKFKLVKNQKDVHAAMSNLLIERQSTEKHNTVVENIISSSNADELKKYKDLLDNGVINQEEFDQKKKQLLGL